MWSVQKAPSFAFYMAQIRAWELLTGSLLALGFFPPLRSKAWREGLAFIGIALIVSAVCLFSSRTPFPSYYALVPVLGTAFVIYASHDTTCGRILSLRPVVFIGLISYSLYLWHWPIMVFARYYLIDELSGWNVIAVLLLSLCAAILSWHYIEMPFRRKGIVKRHLSLRQPRLQCSSSQRPGWRVWFPRVGRLVFQPMWPILKASRTTQVYGV